MPATRGDPLQGSRSAHDVTDPDLHASDIEDAAFTVHMDPAAAEGEAMVMGGAGEYVATDIVTEAELTLHTADPAAHHDPVTLGAGDAALSIIDQVLTLADVLTPTEHTAIGNDSPHHTAVTLGAGNDAALALSGQELTLTLDGSSGEVLMQDGVTAPPVPIETEAQDDWLFEG